MASLTTNKVLQKRARRARAHRRLRQTLSGTAERPRLTVFKSDRYVYAQLIDDEAGRTLVSAKLEGATGNRAAAKLVGETVADRAVANGIKKVVFDRGGYPYHGKVKELADAARAKGLEF